MFSARTHANPTHFVWSCGDKCSDSHNPIGNLGLQMCLVKQRPSPLSGKRTDPEFMAAFFFFINLFNLFIYFWLHWVFVAARGLSLVAASRGYSSLRCTGLSLRWLLLLQSTGSRYVGFSSCGTRASVVVAHGL